MIAALLWTPCAAGAQDATRRAPPRAVIVFDASGSMWGRMGQGSGSKADIARAAIEAALPAYRGRLRLGLVAYGHRRKRDCRDVQLLVPADRALRPRPFSQAVRSISPRGHTPMTMAIETAAQALGRGGEPGTVILLSDGFENCGRDPCASVRALREARPGLRVHVIALAMKPRDYRRIACVARAGGGRLVMTRNREEVRAALADMLGRAAGLAWARSPAAGALPQPARAPDGPPGLMLAALLGPKGPVAEGGLHWRVRRVDGGKTGKAVVYEGRAPVPIIEAPAGRYKVTVSYGKVRVERMVEVKPKGTTRANIVLNAALLRLRARARKDGAPLDNVYFTLYRVAPAGVETVAIAHGAKAEFRVPPGAYRVEVQYGFAGQEQAVHLAPGMRKSVDVVLYFGELALRTVATPGGPSLERVFYFVYEDAPETATGLREVARSAASRPVFTLPAGTYHVVARHGRAEARARVAVRAGMQTRRVLDVRSGRLKLASRIAGRAEPIGDRVSYTILPLGTGQSARPSTGASGAAGAAGLPAAGVLGPRAAGAGAQPVRTAGPRAVLDVAAGRYRVLGRYGAVNARASREVWVRPGGEAEAVLEYRAGTVALRLARVPGGVALRDVFWELADEAGRVIWTSGRPSPRMPLAAGKYRLTATYRDRRYEAAFRLAVGESKTIEVLAR